MAQFPSPLAGMGITAALLLQMIMPTVIKPADQSLASNTTLQNDNALFLPLNANATYIFTSYIDYEGGTQGSSDLKLQWTVPAGATMKFAPLWTGTGGVFQIGHDTAAQTVTAGTNGAGVARGMFMIGTLSTAGTTGNLQLQWAQGTSNATATIVHQGSCVAIIETS